MDYPHRYFCYYRVCVLLYIHLSLLLLVPQKTPEVSRNICYCLLCCLFYEYCLLLFTVFVFFYKYCLLFTIHRQREVEEDHYLQEKDSIRQKSSDRY